MVRVWAGMSWSEAVAVKDNSNSSLTVLLPMAASTGATLTSLTVTVMVSQTGSATPSLTQTSKVYSPGPCNSVGVQVKSPPAVMAAPLGAPTRLKVRVWAGMSWSEAVAVKDNSNSSLTVLLPMAASTGATLTSLTVTVMVSQTGSATPSLTQTSKVYSPG